MLRILYDCALCPKLITLHHPKNRLTSTLFREESLLLLHYWFWQCYNCYKILSTQYITHNRWIGSVNESIPNETKQTSKYFGQFYTQKQPQHTHTELMIKYEHRKLSVWQILYLQFYLLIVRSLNLSYQDEKLQLRTCSFFILCLLRLFTSVLPINSTNDC